MSSAAAAVRRRYLKRFSEANAFDIKNARSLEELGLKDRLAFRRLVARGVFVETANHKFYVDCNALEMYKTAQRKILLAVIFVIIIIMILIMFFENR